MDIKKIIENIKNALDLKIKDECLVFWNQAIEEICNERKVTDCRTSKKSGALILMPDDIPVVELKTPILKRVAELKKAAGFDSSVDKIVNPVPVKVYPIEEDKWWTRFLKQMNDTEQKSPLKDLFVTDEWNAIKDGLLGIVNLDTFFDFKNLYSKVSEFALDVKTYVLSNKPEKIDRQSVDEVLKSAILNLGKDIDLRW